MSRNWRAALAALCAVVIAAVALPAGVDAQKVQNPGPFSLLARGGQIQLGSGLGLDLEPNPLPQCSDGLDNDADTRVDSLDSQCAAGPSGQPRSADDSEIAPGFQPKINLSITGSINGNGIVTIPASGVVFPPAYIAINFNGVWIVKAEVLATQPATGTIDPLTGNVVLDVAARIKLSGNVGNQLAPGCSIGTTNNPLRLNLVSGRKEPIGTNGAITGSPYNSVTGRAVLVDNAFAVPGSTGCTAGIFDLNSTINGQVGIPSAAGRNAAVLAGETSPFLAKAITPVITSSPSLNGNQAPFSVSLSGATSSVAAGPATYSWAFSDGTTATGENVDKTFAAGNQSVTLTVIDRDGDRNSVTSFFVVSPGSGTTSTTVAPTTSTTSTTVAPTTSTTAAPTTSTTSTTVAPTTSTTSTTAAPTTSTTSTTAAPTTSTTSTTMAPTTSTTSTTMAPTTSTTSTTMAPTTSTTSTTIPQPSDDSVDVSISGAVSYDNAGGGTGDIAVRRDANGIVSVQGSLDIAGTAGGTATVTANVQRAWILPLWVGQVSVRDQGATVNVTAPVFGRISRGAAATTAEGTANWFVLGTFPNLFRPYTLNWSVTDAD